MATGKLIGTDTQCSDNEVTGYVVWDKFVASASGILSEIHIYCAVTGHAKVAVYADNGGVPGYRLAKQDTSTAVAAGAWRTISLEASCNIISGTTYHLAHVIDNQGSIVGQNSGGVSRYYEVLPGTYADWTWPDNAPSLTAQANFLSSIAGWGILVLSPSGIASLGAFGTDKVNRNVKPSGVATLEAIGSHVLSISGARTLIPSGIATAGVFGAAKFLFHLLPPGIATLQGLGSPKLNYKLALAGIASGEALGALSLIIFLQPTVKFIGAGDVSVDSYAEVDKLYLSKFTAQFSGDITQIRILSEGNANVKLALYEDNTGEPGNLLNAVNTVQAVVAGWNRITFPSTAVVLGTNYWLAFNSG